MKKTYIILLGSLIACTSWGMYTEEFSRPGDFISASAPNYREPEQTSAVATKKVRMSHELKSLFEYAVKQVLRNVNEKVEKNLKIMPVSGQLNFEIVRKNIMNKTASLDLELPCVRKRVEDEIARLRIADEHREAVIEIYDQDIQDCAQEVYRQRQDDIRMVDRGDWTGLCNHVRRDGAWKNILNYIQLLELPDHQSVAVLGAYLRLHRLEDSLKSCFLESIDCYNVCPHGKRVAFATHRGRYTDLWVITQSSDGGWHTWFQAGKNMYEDDLRNSLPENIYWNAEGVLYTIHSGENKYALKWNESYSEFHGGPAYRLAGKYTPEDWEAFYSEQRITPAVNHQSLTGDFTIEKVDDYTIKSSSVILSCAAMDKYLENQYSRMCDEWDAGRDNHDE